ncbi:MAG TPA: Ig-like domain-containing protein, partial [Candidatus Limnocylindrales bacterium]|nr:Ig-like domain-containing protein [Candidatus Limnocylindrales bacterium]
MFRPRSDLDPSPETAPDPDPTPAAQQTSARRPRRTIPPIPRRTAAIGMTALGIVSILTGMLAAAMQPQPAPETAGASARPSIAVPAGPSASPTPTPVDTAFHPIEGTAARPIARLSAIGAAGAVVPLDASFRLETASETPVAELVRRLTIEPATGVSSRTDGAAVVLTPKSPLRPGAVYRFALHGAGGELLDTWAFQAKQPVRIVGTLPGDRQADIPLDTGIEVTFDQDGVVDAAAHVTIDPATAGRFEMHGRTLAFVPNRPLKRSTLYTVTVSPGIVAATGEATATETRFQFETGIAGSDTDPLTFTFNDVLAESPTDERPVIGIWAFGGDRARMPKSIHLAVYRLANLDAGIAAWRTLRARPSWTRWSTTGLVDPSGLQRVVAAELPLRSMENAWFVELPERLPVGWYLVAQNDGARPAQQVLQVSDVSGYLAVSETRTVVWANDIKTRRPIAGATASAGSERLGRTDARGLINARTPGGLVPEAGSRCTTPCDPVVIVRAPDGRSIFLPAAAGSDRVFDGGGYFYWDSDPGWWSLLHVDRVRYRVGDTLNVWGMARDRDTGSVPAHARLSVTPAESETGDAPPLASTVLSTRSTGAFSGSISLAGLPEGGYVVSLAIGDRTLRSTWFSIGVIAKPAYTLSASTARRIYLAGERVTVRVDARFYEGTPVPGVPVQFEGTVDGSATTTSDGIARRSGIAAAGEGGFEPDMQTIDVRPARAEEGEIGGATAAIFVFPGSRTIDSTARIADGRVRVSGTVHLVARNRLERALADGAEFWDLDPRGAPVANATVTVRFVERIPVRTQTGTQYDFIEKKVVPVYEVDVRELAAGTIRVRTDAKGRWSASIPATPTDHDYSVTAAVGDPAGRIARADAFAARRTDVSDLFSTSASLRLTAGDPDNAKTFRVGDEIDVT